MNKTIFLFILSTSYLLCMDKPSSALKNSNTTPLRNDRFNNQLTTPPRQQNNPVCPNVPRKTSNRRTIQLTNNAVSRRLFQ